MREDTTAYDVSLLSRSPFFLLSLFTFSIPRAHAFWLIHHTTDVHPKMSRSSPPSADLSPWALILIGCAPRSWRLESCSLAYLVPHHAGPNPHLLLSL